MIVSLFSFEKYKKSFHLHGHWVLLSFCFFVRFLDFWYREKVCLKCVCKKRRKSFPQTRVPFEKLEKGFEADNGRSKRGGFAGAKWKRSGTRAISRGSTCTLQGIGIDRWKWGGGGACNAHRRGSPSAAKALCNIQLPKYQLAESGADSSDREKRLSSSASVLPRCLWEIRWQLHLSTVHSPQSFPDNSWPTTCTRSIHTSDICMYLRKNSFSPFLLSLSLFAIVHEIVNRIIFLSFKSLKNFVRAVSMNYFERAVEISRTRSCFSRNFFPYSYSRWTEARLLYNLFQPWIQIKMLLKRHWCYWILKNRYVLRMNINIIRRVALSIQILNIYKKSYVSRLYK